jgi:hypothetical protein
MIKIGDIFHHHYDLNNKYILLTQNINGLSCVFDFKRKNVLVVSSKFLEEGNFISI